MFPDEPEAREALTLISSYGLDDAADPYLDLYRLDVYASTGQTLSSGFKDQIADFFGFMPSEVRAFNSQWKWGPYLFGWIDK